MSLDDSCISNEDIKHLIFRSEPEELKFPMYRSKFSKMVRDEAKTGKECHQTLGYAYDYPKPDPTKDYLKKGSRVYCRVLPDERDITYLKPRTIVPKHNELLNLANKTPPNFIKLNIKKIDNALPKTGPSRFVTSKGFRFHNCNLLIPKFAWHKGFGKVPQYIKDIKSELDENKRLKEEHWLQHVEKMKETQGLKRISSQERLELLNSLKVAWGGLQREFQLLPMLNDTPPKIKHKEHLEQELTALEKQIQSIEDHHIIYVYDDPTDSACANYKKDPCYEH